MAPGTDSTAPPPAVAQFLQGQAARWWWVPLVAAGAWVVIAWLVLRADYRSLATVGVLVGVAFLLAAVNEGALAAVVRGWWAALHAGLAVVFVLGAVWAFVRPVNTFFALASVLGLLLFLQGIVTLSRGIAMREDTPHWWLELLSGGLLILLAIWVSTSDGVWDLAGRASFILLWIGFMAVFRAISDVMLAFSLRRLGNAGPPAGPADDAPPVPPQQRRAPEGATAPQRTPTA